MSEFLPGQARGGVVGPCPLPIFKAFHPVISDFVSCRMSVMCHGVCVELCCDFFSVCENLKVD